LEFMRQAIQLAALSAQVQSHDNECPPAVGVVVVGQDGRRLASAFRSEPPYRDSHAEFIALERKLKRRKIIGATIYTTLEPCVDVRSPKKTDCAILIANKRVSEVIIGMMDPNDRV